VEKGSEVGDLVKDIEKAYKEGNEKKR